MLYILKTITAAAIQTRRFPYLRDPILNRKIKNERNKRNNNITHTQFKRYSVTSKDLHHEVIEIHLRDTIRLN